jgi:hypothetical protein
MKVVCVCIGQNNQLCWCLLVDIGGALGLYQALQWVCNMQLDNIDFEVDFKTTKYVVYSVGETSLN